MVIETNAAAELVVNTSIHETKTGKNELDADFIQSRPLTEEEQN